MEPCRCGTSIGAFGRVSKAEYVASYRAIASVRAKIGFAGMTGHGWLTNDRSVQYSDWDTGDRVIVNFGKEPFQRPGKQTVKAASFVLERRMLRRWVRRFGLPSGSVVCARSRAPLRFFR